MMVSRVTGARRPWRKISLGLVATALVTFGVAVCLTLSYLDTRPTSSQPELGRVYLLNNHGRLVYLTATEAYLRIGLYAFSVAVFVAGALLDWFLVRRPALRSRTHRA